MAGFFAHFGPSRPHRLHAAAERFRYADEHEVLVAEDGFSFAWSGFNDPALFAPAHDPETGVRVVTAGRVSWDEAEWRRAEGLVRFDGGLSNRLLLEAYLRGGLAAIERYDGPAMLVVWDPRERVVHLLSDPLGYHPIFLYRPEAGADGAVIATHPDVLADDEEVSTTPDLVTAAEFLRFWRATPPHTYYREIKYAGPAAHWRWDLSAGTVHERRYWQPYQEDPFPSVDAAAEELAAALKRAVHIRTTERLGPTVTYASGGMDSRTVFFAAAAPEHMIGLNMYDVFNRESAISKQICEAASVRYEGFERDFDYYPRWMPELARLSGAMWSTEDGHFLGTWERVREIGARTVISGCTADRVFKASGMEYRYKQLFGRNIPVKELVPERADVFLPNHPSRPAPEGLADAIRERFEARFEGTPRTFERDEDWLAVEDRRVRPNCYASSVSGPIMYRIFPYDTFLADRHVVDCYGRMRAEWKLNSIVWGKAVARVSGANKGIDIANFGWRLDDSTPKRMLSFAKGWVKRRLPSNKAQSVAGQGPATDGSWPWLGWYVRNSPTIRAMWEDATTAERELITEVWGANPWDVPLERWARRPNDLFRIFTLLNYWRSRREAGTPVFV
jgi:hypothetical protein